MRVFPIVIVLFPSHFPFVSYRGKQDERNVSTLDNDKMKFYYFIRLIL